MTNRFSIDINCDMGEGVGNEALLMPCISSVNIACGYHAGDEDTMLRVCDMAVENTVAVGAHPGFADKVNFGRTEMRLTAEEITDLIATQVYTLQKIARKAGAEVTHVKPHGALYNMSARDAMLARTIALAVKNIQPSLVLFGLSGSCSVQEAMKAGLQVASEVFADRTYQDDGSLTPRTQPNALINTREQALQQVLQMVRQQCVTSVHNRQVPIKADTLCIHGDGSHAVQFAKDIYQTLQQHNIVIGKK